ncbi:hypothetical protein B0H66DRAFT_590220 [Apodospora peruviana]|uniref:Uncharacterized protein n=1 Tax=Apodospora peruviana TaxID=516989 RepID=A0AAE0ICN4_9PEZI|nr:hypothetical protein B0H66DRAFT_590220 [Apodospora peruviana]
MVASDFFPNSGEARRPTSTSSHRTPFSQRCIFDKARDEPRPRPRYLATEHSASSSVTDRVLQDIVVHISGFRQYCPVPVSTSHLDGKHVNGYVLRLTRLVIVEELISEGNLEISRRITHPERDQSRSLDALPSFANTRLCKILPPADDLLCGHATRWDVGPSCRPGAISWEDTALDKTNSTQAVPDSQKTTTSDSRTGRATSGGR